MSFTEEELAYLRSQPLARIATVSADGQPDVVPVGFHVDGTHLVVGGWDPANTRRAHNVRGGNAKVALVVDDLLSQRPWTPRYLRIYGTAELVDGNLRITPTLSWSWNLDGRPFGHDREARVRRTVHDTAATPGTTT